MTISGRHFIISSLKVKSTIPTSLSHVSSWTPQNTPANNTWESIAWDPVLSMFAAVAYDGDANTQLIMTSTNGTSWSIQTHAPISFHGICSGGNGMFVGVGVNQIFTSINGSTWTSRTCPSYTFFCAAWSTELSIFVALGAAGGVASSPTGVVWTSRTIGTFSWRSVVWSPTLSKFVAVGINRTAYSSNGIDWTDAAQAGSWEGVTWSPSLSKFVAVASVGTDVITSTDGINWTVVTNVMPQAMWDVSWSPELGLFVATPAQSPWNVAASSDGSTWTAYSTGTSNAWTGVAWSPALGIFAACGNGSGQKVITSVALTTNLHYLSVNGGQPAGVAPFGSGNYVSGTIVPVSASYGGTGSFTFNHWSDDIGYLQTGSGSNPNTILMPGVNVVITPVYT